MFFTQISNSQLRISFRFRFVQTCVVEFYVQNSINEKQLKQIFKNAELRYKNGLEKISAYYKAKAALGYSQNMQLMYESEIRD